MSRQPDSPQDDAPRAPAPDQSETALLLGGRIHTPSSPDATAMAVEGDRIVWIGTDDVGRRLYPGAECVELDGAFVAPAFVDSHVHTTSSGLLLTGLDLTGCASLTEFRHALREHVRDNPGALVWGHGWDETCWPERRAPTRAEIDEDAGDTPVYLSRIDVHSALVSSALLRLAPLAWDAEGYSHTGPLTRVAHHHVRATARESLSTQQRRAAQLTFLRHAASKGVASVHECAGPDISGAEDLVDLMALAERGDLCDVVPYWGELGAFERARSLGVRGLAGDLFVDGALGSRTAALRQPYSDDPSTNGALYLDAVAIADHLIECTQNDLQAGFHVIGEAAMDEVLGGFRKAAETLGAPALAGARHRLEHLAMVSEEQAAELAGFGVAASMQPAFDAAWGGEDGMYARRLGVQRAHGLNPLARLAAHGTPLAFGSDAPVGAVDPWAGVRAAVHHRSIGYGISPRAAFTAHTRGGWRAAGDMESGRLVAGAPATYAVWNVAELVTGAQRGSAASADHRVQRWSTDPRSGVPPLPALHAGAPAPECLRTVLRGQTLYDRESACGWS